AYQLYLKGQYQLGKESEEGFRLAEQAFRQAVETDPSYALAYTGLANIYGLYFDFHILPFNDVFPKWDAAIQKALELDNNLAEAHAGRSFLLMSNWEWAEAERQGRRAIGVTPHGVAPTTSRLTSI